MTTIHVASHRPITAEPARLGSVMNAAGQSYVGSDMSISMESVAKGAHLTTGLVWGVSVFDPDFAPAVSYSGTSPSM